MATTGPPVITYPGLNSALTLRYEAAHGIQPGLAFISATVNGNSLSWRGDLYFAHNNVAGSGITLPDCIVQNAEGRRVPGDYAVEYVFRDRRWAWQLGPPVYGHYNQLDQHGKLLPIWVRSPYQLAELCLDAMGEVGYTIDMPVGLAGVPGLAGAPAIGPGDTEINYIGQYLTLGRNFPPTGSNLLVNWDGGITAAQALAQLCDRFGRRIVYNYITNTVNIVQMGTGAGPPSLSAEVVSIGYTYEVVPQQIIVSGPPSPIQMRFMLRAVAEEWDGSHVPLSEVSYAPLRTPQPMIVYVNAPSFHPLDIYQVIVNDVVFDAGPAVNMAAIVASLVLDISTSADPRVAGIITASSIVVGGVTTLKLTATNNNEFTIRTNNTTGDWIATCIQGPVPSTSQIPAVFQTVCAGQYTAGDIFTLTVNGVLFTAFNVTWTTYREAMNDLQNQIQTSGSGAIVGKVTVGVWDFGIQIENIIPGVGLLTVTSGRTASDPFGTFITSTVRDPNLGSKGFEYTAPALGIQGFYNVNPTPRLNWSQAMSLAARSVYRRYKLLMVDPGDKLPGIKVPTFYDPANDPATRVFDRSRIVLRDIMPEQVVPRGGDTDRIDSLTGAYFAVEHYDGYSRNRKPRSFGSVAAIPGNGNFYTGQKYLGTNTDPASETYVPFHIVDVENGIIEFEQPMYKLLGQALESNPYQVTVQPTNPIIETGCFYLDPVTNVPWKEQYVLNVPCAIGPVAEYVYEDVQTEFIGVYDSYHNLRTVTTVDNYGMTLASEYATQILNTFQTPVSGLTKLYGIQQVAPTGQILNVQFEISSAGFFTTCSVNTETSRVIPPHAARRRIENLPPDPAQVEQNLNSGRNNRNAVERELRGRH